MINPIKSVLRCVSCIFAVLAFAGFVPALANADDAAPAAAVENDGKCEAVAPAAAAEAENPAAPAAAEKPAAPALDRPKLTPEQRAKQRAEMRAEMRARHEKFRAAMDEKSLEIIKKYVPDEEKAKALLGELNAARRPARRGAPAEKPQE